MSMQPKKGTVCFLIKENKILLLLLDYPSGKKVWSGVGGMMDANESLEECVVREGKEELAFAIDKTSLKKVSIINESPTFQLTVFLADKWIGEPKIHDQTIKALQWFDKDHLPYEHMWPDNRYWLPQILTGKLLKVTVLKNIYEDTSVLQEKDVHINEVLSLI